MRNFHCFTLLSCTNFDFISQPTQISVQAYLHLHLFAFESKFSHNKAHVVILYEPCHEKTCFL